MRRRNFLKTAAGAALSVALPGRRHFLSGIEGSGTAERTYRVLGVPLRSGSLYPGTENDAQAYRDAKLVARLQSAGCRVVDEGDVAIIFRTIRCLRSAAGRVRASPGNACAIASRRSCNSPAKYRC